MPTGSHLSVGILFITPNGTCHRRMLSGVPRSVALKMARDFEEYGDPESDIAAHQLYRFGGDGGERLTAIDFREVAAIEAGPEGAVARTAA